MIHYVAIFMFTNCLANSSVAGNFSFDQSRFINESLLSHNKYRRLHDAPDLTHNFSLSEMAQKWAEKLAELDSLKHSENKNENRSVGENILKWHQPGVDYLDGAFAPRQWYKEINEYKFSNPEYSNQTSHFTQLIWKNTLEVGFGIAKTSNNVFYIVAKYYPAGNIPNKFTENVYPIQETYEDNLTAFYMSIATILFLHVVFYFALFF